MKKRAFITGITGMVGSHLLDYLYENTNDTIIGICRWRSPLNNVKKYLSEANDESRIIFDFADLNDITSLIRVINNFKPAERQTFMDKMMSDIFKKIINEGNLSDYVDFSSDEYVSKLFETKEKNKILNFGHFLIRFGLLGP